MVQFNGHFDGNVITPDESVNIPVNTPLRITIAIEADEAKETTLGGTEDLADGHDRTVHDRTAEGEQLVEKFKKYRGMLGGVSLPEIVEFRHRGLP